MSPPWRYRFLIRLLGPALLVYTGWRGIKDGGWRYCAQRLGFYGERFYQAPSTSSSSSPAPVPAQTLPGSLSSPQQEHNSQSVKRLWIHAASVGEVITVQALVKSWLAAHEDGQITFTTGTPTGATVLAGLTLPRVHHQYLPIDFPGACARFFSQLDASEAWVVETEIWPWLYAYCARVKLPLTIVNGRLSDKTSKQEHGLLASSYRQALQSVRVLSRSEDDRNKFIRLGADAAQVYSVGNLKYANPAGIEPQTALIPQAYVLAASTHEDEEIQLAGSWVKEINKDAGLLVIAPRHPERAAAILQKFRAMGLVVAQRSKGEIPGDNDKIYLADSLGELQVWYQFAQAAFVGGSLIPRGGHNVLEPARYACPVVVGPYTHNFDDIMGLMISHDAIKVSQSAGDVCKLLVAASKGDQNLKAMGNRAQLVATDSTDVLNRYREFLF